MGGLACRKLAMMDGLNFKVLSVTTIGTPHYGSNLAYFWKVLFGKNIPLHCECPPTFFPQVALPLLSWLPSWLYIGDGNAFNDLVPSSMSKFSSNTPLIPEVHYFSCSAVVNPKTLSFAS